MHDAGRRARRRTDIDVDGIVREGGQASPPPPDGLLGGRGWPRGPAVAPGGMAALAERHHGTTPSWRTAIAHPLSYAVGERHRRRHEFDVGVNVRVARATKDGRVYSDAERTVCRDGADMPRR